MFLLKKLFYVAFVLAAQCTYANSTFMDEKATVIYAPTITINPDEQEFIYPSELSVKLLLSKEGNVLKVYFSNGTPPYIISKTEHALKAARFTPYKKQGIAVRSIVPYTVNFYILSEEEYRGH